MAELPTLTTDINNAPSSTLLNELLGRIAALETLTGGISTPDLTDLLADVAALETLTSGHTTSLTSLSSTVSGNSSDITTLEGLTSSQATSIAGLVTDMLTVEGNITDIRAKELGLKNVRDLGCIPMHEDGGLDIDNALLINEFLSEGFVAEKHAGLFFPGGGWGIKTPIVVPSIEGFCFYGEGVGDIRGELQYNDPEERGGLTSRIVATEPNLAYLVQVYNIFFHIQGVMLQGWYHNLRDDGATGVLREPENYALVGLKIMPRYTGVGNTGIGTGKVTSPNLVICCCQKGIECGDTGDSDEDNADQFQLGRLNTPACDIGFKSLNLQSVGHFIGQYEGNLCDVMFDFERGGKMTVVQATLIQSGGTLLKTRANGINEGIFHFIDLWVDARAGSSCKVWENQEPDFVNGGQETSCEVRIEHMMLDATFSGSTLFYMRPYNSLTINGSNKLCNNIVQVTGGVALFHPMILFNGCRFNTDMDLDSVIKAATSDGYAAVAATNCRAFTGAGGFKDARYIWEDGVITRVPLSLLMGGTGASTAAGARANLGTGAVIQGGIAIGNPSASTTYRGVGGDTGFTSAAEHSVRTITIPRSGTIKAVYFRSHAFGTQASATGGTLALRLNETTNTTITSNFNASGTNNNTSLGIAVSAGDRIAFQLDTPAWVTAPTTVYASFAIHLE